MVDLAAMLIGQMTAARYGRVRRPKQLLPSEASNVLATARQRYRLQLQRVAVGLDVHPRTVRRWETGETRPSRAEWNRIVSYFSKFVPRDAVELAQAAGVASPFPAPVSVDRRAIEDAILRAADVLDVSPRRVREAVRDI